MPSFTKNPTNTTPFGKNQYLRSTRDCKFESFTLAASTVPTQSIDGTSQKILQSGTVLAKITSGDEAGKVGPFEASATDGRESTANIVGINDTFLPWQLLERDVEVAALVEGRVVQGWCLTYGSASDLIALPDPVAAEMVSKKSLSILFS